MPENITRADAQLAMDLIRTICTQVGPGLPGSSQERERAAMVKTELESHLGAGNVHAEEFTVAPGAFLGVLPISALFTLIAALLNISTQRIPGVSPWLTAENGGNVPGAADNLAASALAVALCKFLVRNPATIPAGTEIRFISFGSEEAGLRGSRRYVERHLGELKRLEARVLNFEVVAHPEIDILTSDVSGVKNNPEIVKSVVAAAKRSGVPYKVKTNPTSGGGSEAGSFSQAGLKATTPQSFKVPQQMVAFYHQKWDGPEILTIEPLLNVLRLTFEWVHNGGE